MGKATFTYSVSENDLGGWLFYCYFRDDEQAEEAVSDIQSICGASLERDGEFVYFLVDESQLVEALTELADDGYDASEG